MPYPRSYALVLDPTFIGPNINVKFSKVLIDNGSSINILYKDKMHKLGINENMLQSTKTIFHGIVPGLSCELIGKVRIDVLFGTRENCRTENLESRLWTWKVITMHWRAGRQYQNSCLVLTSVT